MFAQFDTSVIANSWVYLFQVGMVFTLKLTALAMVGGIVLIQRMSARRLAA